MVRRRNEIMFGAVFALCVSYALYQTTRYHRAFSSTLKTSEHHDAPKIVAAAKTTPVDVDALGGGGDEKKEPEAEEDDADANCPFVDSPLYRKVYVYEHPNVGPPSMAAFPNRTYEEWPWIQYQKDSKAKGTAHYGVGNQVDQYALEIIVHRVLADTCLRTRNPETAELFYVPFLNSVDRWKGVNRFPQGYGTSKYGKAMSDVVDKEDYDSFERTWGITAKYWRRKKGADHISVQAEPLHGFWHPASKRGNFHFVNSQYQLRPNIVLSVELSKTFVEMYPKCAAKNVVVPYPNPDGRNFNGEYDKNARRSDDNDASERRQQRPFSSFYKAGNHGTCSKLRKALAKDYQCYEPSKESTKIPHGEAMRRVDFCPCPGGDSPSAKRMYDAVLAGCVPTILSEDFVWALSQNYDDEEDLDPSDFELRLDAKEWTERRTADDPRCSSVDADNKPPLWSFLADRNETETARLKRGTEAVRERYSYWASVEGRPTELLRNDVLPDGGAVRALVKALERRAGGRKWPACEEELKGKSNVRQPTSFKC